MIIFLVLIIIFLIANKKYQIIKFKKMANNSDKTEIILKDHHIMRNLFILALPIMFNNLLKSVHDIVDLYYVGEIVIPGVEEAIAQKTLEAMFSAINITTPIINICQALAMGFMVAGLALMSQYLGAGKQDKASLVSGQLMMLCILVGIIMNVLLFALAPTILNLMGAKDEIYKYSVIYVRYRSFELIGLFVFYAFQATRQSAGDTISPVILNVITIILNIILSGIFILGFKMHVNGAALGTVISNMIIIPICLLMLFKDKKSTIVLKWEHLKINFKYTKKVFSLGIPAALSHAFTSLAFVLINSLVLSFESNIVAGISGGNKINSLLLFPAMGIGTVLSTFVGQNIGANNIKRAKSCVVNGVILSLIITVGGSILLSFISRPMVNFILRNTPNAVEPCMRYMYFLIVGLPAMGLFQIFIGTFQGAGQTNLGLILSAARLWVFRIPVIWFLINIVKMQESSVWYAMLISNFGAIILGLFLFNFVDFKPRISSNKKRLEKLKEA